MFFRFFGRLIRSTWAFFLIGWVLLLLGTHFAAPRFDEVAQDREFAFLPANVPSRQADEMVKKAFPDDNYPSNIVVVVHRDEAARGQRARDRKFIENVLEPALFQIAQDEGGLATQAAPAEEPLFGDDQESRPAEKPSRKSIIARIRTPNTPGAGALLVSPDGKALLVVLDLTTEFLSTQNWPTIERIEGLVRDLRDQGKVPEGVDLSLTGSAVIGRDHNLAQLESVRATEWLTVVLVIGLLILIYRAPLLALIPLLTVYLGVQISLNLLALLGQAGWMTLFQGIQIYIIILAYGAGVDYCLFLTARYREELHQGANPAEAVERAVGSVGSAVVASAATVMCGIAMMFFAQFGKFQQAGLAIPLSLVVVLAATLTFSPSLLLLVGRWAFWPRHGDSEAEPASARWSFLNRLDRIWHDLAGVLLRRPVAVWVGTVAVMTPFVVVSALCYNRVSYDLIGNLPATAPSVAGTRVLEEHFPPGITGPVTVLLIDEKVDFSKPAGREFVQRVTDQLRTRKEKLALADVRSLTAPLGITAAAKAGFEDVDVPEEVRRKAAGRAALEAYTTDLGGRGKVGTRLDLVLNESPFAQSSIEDLDQIEAAIRDALPAGVAGDMQLYLAGTTSSVRDLAVTMQSDRRRIEGLVLASVFAVLVVLLHSFVVPVYLLLSVLFSYFVTMGVAFTVFWLLDPHGFTGIDWKVAIFLFTILIAVGEDYNIFLMTRVHEEQREFGPVRGITEALTRTGPIISSCGIIMAGTFASLLAGSLTEMKQLGFALPFGVLLDTFVVRPILLPTFLIVLARLRRPGSPAEEGLAQERRPQESRT